MNDLELLERKRQQLAHDLEMQQRAAEGRPTVQDYWNGDYDEDDYDTGFSGWQNSSTFC